VEAALGEIAFLPFALLVDEWRCDVFAGRVEPADYYKQWWDLELLS
jgi:peptidyl-dipeptidase A